MLPPLFCRIGHNHNLPAGGRENTMWMFFALRADGVSLLAVTAASLFALGLWPVVAPVASQAHAASNVVAAQAPGGGRDYRKYTGSGRGGPEHRGGRQPAASATSLQLLQGAEQGDSKTVRAALEAGADPNASNRQGLTALMLAAREGHRTIVRAVLDAGADINAGSHGPTRRGLTALMLAAEFDEPRVARLLIDRGADVDAQDLAGTTALMLAARHAASKSCAP